MSNPYDLPDLPSSRAGDNIGTRRSRGRFGAMGWLSSLAIIAYICRNCIAPAESTIRTELGLSKEQMGLFMSYFFYSYALAQIPTGLLGQFAGSRRMLTLYSAASAIATAAMSFFLSLGPLLVFRVLQGLGQAGLFPCSTMVISRWIPKVERGMATGILGCSMNLGTALASVLTGFLLDYLQWQVIFCAFASLGVFWSVGFYLWFRDDPAQHRSVNSNELKWIRGDEPGQKESATESALARPAADDVGLFTAFLAIGNVTLFWVCAQQFCRAAAAMFFTSWFPTYLQEAKNVSVAESGFLNMLPTLSLMAGGFSAGLVTDRVFRWTNSLRWARQGVAVTGMCMCAAFVFLAAQVADPLGSVLLISCGTFFAATAGPCAYAVTIDVGGRCIPFVFGTMNMVGNLGAGAFGQWVPEVEKRYGWDGVITLFGALFVVAAISWLCINPTREIPLARWRGFRSSRD